MSLFNRIAKKIRRRFRIKGTLVATTNRRGRNYHGGVTAQGLWARTYYFRETPAKRSGYKRRLAREKLEKRNRR